MALSLYNKYRPQTFKDVVGQDHVEKTLANAVEKNKVSHAYLFCGPRGTGKTTTARILAKALMCKNAPTATPDGTCEHCREISDGVHPDVYELDAASRTGVDNVREEIISRVSYAPTHGAYKIYIIDEVHMLSNAAFNALLKTLEEPPSHVVFMLCTTDVHKVPDTVQARCQRFDFKHLAVSDIVGRLQYICEREGFDCEPAALELIAHRSQGGMRDAIRSLEQVAVFSGGKITYGAAESLLGMVDTEQIFALCNSLAEGDAASCFSWVAGYVQSGSDIAILVTDLAVHIRNLYAVMVTQGPDSKLASALEVDAMALPKLKQQAAAFETPEQLAWILTVLGTLSADLKNAANARLALEVALTRILHPQSEQSLEALTARVAALEAKLARAGGTGVAGTGSVSAAANSAETASPAPVAEASQPVAAPVQETAPVAQAVQETAPANTQTTAASEAPVAKDLPESAPKSSSSKEGEQELYRKWNDVVDTIKKERGMVAASLGGASPRLGNEDKRLTIELPAGATQSLKYLEMEANRSLLIKTVEKIFAAPLEVALAVATDTAPQRETAVAVQAESPRPARAEESAPENAASEEPSNEPVNEPSKEELANILSNSLGSQIQFEEH